MNFFLSFIWIWRFSTTGLLLLWVHLSKVNYISLWLYISEYFIIFSTLPFKLYINNLYSMNKELNWIELCHLQSNLRAVAYLGVLGKNPNHLISIASFNKGWLFIILFRREYPPMWWHRHQSQSNGNSQSDKNRVLSTQVLNRSHRVLREF